MRRVENGHFVEKDQLCYGSNVGRSGAWILAASLLSRVPRPRRPRRKSLAGDLLEIEGWYFIEDHEICVDFLVTWRHPEQGISGVYRSGGCGFGVPCEPRDFGIEHLAMLAEHAREDARVDFAHDGGHFARDLRISPVRDTTDAETYAALRAGPPYPRSRGRNLGAEDGPPPDFAPEPGWRQVMPPLGNQSGGEPIVTIREGDPLPPGWREVD